MGVPARRSVSNHNRRMRCLKLRKLLKIVTTWHPVFVPDYSSKQAYAIHSLQYFLAAWTDEASSSVFKIQCLRIFLQNFLEYSNTCEGPRTTSAVLYNSRPLPVSIQAHRKKMSFVLLLSFKNNFFKKNYFIHSLRLLYFTIVLTLSCFVSCNFFIQVHFNFGCLFPTSFTVF